MAKLKTNALELVPSEPSSRSATVYVDDQRPADTIRDDSHRQVSAPARGLLVTAGLTDAGNAECMALLFRDRFRYCHTRQKWLWWDGARWKLDYDGEAERAALSVARERQLAASDLADFNRIKDLLSWSFRSENTNKRKALLQTASILPTFKTTVDTYDQDPMLAGAINGTVDLRTGCLRRVRRSDYITMQLGTIYDADARCPVWQRFIDEICGGDKELATYLQRAFGYSLTGDTSEQKLFMCYGDGANGKSVFLEVLQALLHDYAATASFDTFDADTMGGASNDIASLRGKRVVAVIEANEDRRLSEGRVKALTGRDRISCRFLYGEFFSYLPNFKVWMATNHKPIIRGTDRGIWRRIQLIPFRQSFEGREDRDLHVKLKAELPGILNWALEGLALRGEHGLGTAAAVEAATLEYREDDDAIGQWLDECVVLLPEHVTSARETVASCEKWCVRQGYPPPTPNQLGRRLTTIPGVRRERRHGERSYIGLGLKFSGKRDEV